MYLPSENIWDTSTIIWKLKKKFILFINNLLFAFIMLFTIYI